MILLSQTFEVNLEDEDIVLMCLTAFNMLEDETIAQIIRENQDDSNGCRNFSKM